MTSLLPEEDEKLYTRKTQDLQFYFKSVNPDYYFL